LAKFLKRFEKYTKSHKVKIAVIGSGNVGGALAKGWAKAGHQVLLGARDVNASKVGSLLEFHEGISAHAISEAAQGAEVILLAATPQAVKEISDKLGDTSGKVIIDAMNSVFAKPEPFSNTTAALLEYTSTKGKGFDSGTTFQAGFFFHSVHFPQDRKIIIRLQTVTINYKQL